MKVLVMMETRLSRESPLKECLSFWLNFYQTANRFISLGHNNEEEDENELVEQYNKGMS